MTCPYDRAHLFPDIEGEVGQCMKNGMPCPYTDSTRCGFIQQIFNCYAEHSDELYYYTTWFNRGWKCLNCQNEIGESPGLDRLMIFIKCWGLIQDLCDAKLIYLSNGSETEILAETVANKCKELGRYDQNTIVRMVIDLKLKGVEA